MPKPLRRSRVVVLSAFLALLALVAVPLTSAVAKRDGRGPGHGHGHHQPTIAAAARRGDRRAAGRVPGPS